MLEPVLAEVARRGHRARLLLAEPAAGFARRGGLDVEVLPAGDLAAQAAMVLAREPTTLLLGTSPSPVAEREIARRAGPAVRAVAVLDALLFVERRFGPALRDLPSLVACPDDETAARLIRAGAAAERAIVTGNPVLETVAERAPELERSRRDDPDGPVEVLFVSQPVVRIGGADDPFAIDERETLADLLTALQTLLPLAPDGFLVRVRWHPTQIAEPLPPAPPGVALAVDDEPDRLCSVARARLVVGLSSTLLVEARLLPRAAIAYLPGPYWRRERAFPPNHGVRLAGTRAELERALRGAILRPPDPPPVTLHVGAAARIADLVLAVTSGAAGQR